MTVKRETPEPGQESVWDYPRPPRLEDSSSRIRIVAGDLTIADTTKSKRVLETSHPPVYYIPPQDVNPELLQPSSHRSWCEWKGEATYYSVVLPERTIAKAAWCYAAPIPRFSELRDYLAFYPSKMDSCYVDDEEVQAQQGDFYGGWITSRVVGPFKGAPGTFDW